MAFTGVQCDKYGDLLYFGQLFQACGNNYFAQIAHILGIILKVSKSSNLHFGPILKTFSDFLLVTGVANAIPYTAIKYSQNSFV